MELGDILSLVFVGIILLSFLSRFVGEQDAEEGEPVRPTDLSQSGGNEPRPMVAESREATFEDEATVPSRRQREESRGRYEVSTYDDPIEAGDVTRSDARREERPERMGDTKRRRNSSLAREETLERGPSAGSLVTQDGDPGRRARRPQQAAARRRHPATGGDVLRRSLKDPDTLERAFIIKEVLDFPVGMRRES